MALRTGPMERPSVFNAVTVSKVPAATEALDVSLVGNAEGLHTNHAGGRLSVMSGFLLFPDPNEAPRKEEDRVCTVQRNKEKQTGPRKLKKNK